MRAVVGGALEAARRVAESGGREAATRLTAIAEVGALLTVVFLPAHPGETTAAG